MITYSCVGIVAAHIEALEYSVQFYYHKLLKLLLIHCNLLKAEIVFDATVDLAPPSPGKIS